MGVCVSCSYVTVVCVCTVTEVYDTMPYLPIMSDRAATKGSKCFELGRQPMSFFNSKYLLHCQDMAEKMLSSTVEGTV